MELGVHLGSSVMRWPRETRERLVREVERLGLGSIWTGESADGDAATPLGMVATLTETVRVGTAVLPMPARSPAMTAMTAVTLDRLSEGRFVLGIGAADEDADDPPARTRDYVHVLRQALAGERLRIDGASLTLPAAGRPMRMVDRPFQDHLPILVGASGPEDVALCGKIADGWIATAATPEEIRAGIGRIQAAAASVDRDLPAGFEVVLHLRGTADAVGAGAAAYREAGVTTLVVQLAADDADGWERDLHALAELLQGWRRPLPPGGLG